MSDNKPLMPLATAVWLVDNTALSFSQISQFCQLHELEVQSIADGEDAYKMQGLNPIASGLGVTGGEEDGVDNTDIDSSKLYTQPEEVAYAYEQLSEIFFGFY
jgi:hypothetical protein